MIAWARPAPDRLTLQVPRKQLGDVANGEHVGIGNQSKAVVPHQVWNREPKRGEGLQIVRVPGALMAVTQDRPTALVQLRIFAGLENADIESVRVAAVAA